MRLTLDEAAVQLGLSTKTLHRHIKNGSIHADFEDGRYYLPNNEVDRLASDLSTLNTPLLDSPGHSSKGLTNVVSILRAEYNALIARLGYLEGQAQLLLEHKESQEQMAQELEQARAQLDQVKAESRSILEAQAALLKEAQAGAKAKTEALAQVNRRAGRLEVAVGFLLAVVTLGTLAAGVLALLR